MKIGGVDLENNWGNTVIIKHGDYLFSKLSHIKKGSFKVKEGDYVETGQIIGTCGSSEDHQSHTFISNFKPLHLLVQKP